MRARQDSGAPTAIVFAGAVGLALIADLGWAIAGYTGQLSLGRLAFSGLAALIAGRLVATTEVPFALTLPIGVVGTIPVGVLLALPALRTHGLNLAAMTLSFAVAVEEIAFERGYSSPATPSSGNSGLLAVFGGGVEGAVVQGRVRLFGIDLGRTIRPRTRSSLWSASRSVRSWWRTCVAAAPVGG